MPVTVDSHNKIDDDISSLETHTLQHKKVDVPVTKLEMSGAVTDAKVAAVPYAKGSADKKKLSHTGQKDSNILLSNT